MLLAARLTWCITGTAEGTEVQSGELLLGALEPLGAAAPKRGENRLENVVSNAGWLESRDGERRAEELRRKRAHLHGWC